MPADVDLVKLLDKYLGGTGTGTSTGAPSEKAGVDLFEGGFHETPENQLTVVHFDGEPPERSMGPSLSKPDLENVLVLVMARNVSLATARTRAKAFHVLLDNRHDYTSTGGTLYHLIESQDGPPRLIEQDSNMRWVVGASYRVKKAAE